MDRDQYENRLVARGCERIGSGLYSSVFTCPGNPNRAIKVALMDPWPAYIYWATQNGHAGKYAPKVYSLKFHDGYYVAIMERLVCTIREIKYEAHANSEHVAIHRSVYRGWGDEPSDIAPDFQQYVLDLQANRLCNDLHDGNVMLRHDGQIVVIDPHSGEFNSRRFRIKSGACL